MGLPIRLETRTGDTPVYKRQRQKLDPPDILLTTPEQVALLLASKDARRFFKRLKTVIFDELHSLVVSKRGDLLALDLARLRKLAPGLTTIGLSATVAEPDDLCAWLVAQEPGRSRDGSPTGSSSKAARRPTFRSSSRMRSACPGRGTRRSMRFPPIYDADQGAQDDAALRQHALAGGAALPGALARQRRCARDRASSRLARPRAAAKGRSGDGGGKAPRRRRHLDARSRHRLGRRRPRHACRRAEGREPARAANRPRQPPHGRAVEGHPRAVEPLRGAGVPRRARRQLSRAPGHAAASCRHARRALPAHPRHGGRGAVRCGRALRRDHLGGSPIATSPGRTSSAASISSRPAATRSAPTSATPRSGGARTGRRRDSGRSRIRASRSNTG